MPQHRTLSSRSLRQPVAALRRWYNGLPQRLLQHAFAIDAVALGDCAALPWSNLGDWRNAIDYPSAARQLAYNMGQAIQLSSQDRLLDAGCGLGASLQLWQQQFGVQHITAVELQAAAIARIGQHLPTQHGLKLIQGSFCNAALYANLAPFDAIVCVDAAYHYPLPKLLKAFDAASQAQTRLALHYLMVDDAADADCKLSWQQRMALAMVKVNATRLPTAQQLRQQFAQAGWQLLTLEDLSPAVLQGFADYIANQNIAGQRITDKTNTGKINSSKTNVNGSSALARFKIQATAKLCARLAAQGHIRYVQVTAVKAG